MMEILAQTIEKFARKIEGKLMCSELKLSLRCV